MSLILKVWLKSLAYPSGKEGGKFFVQMITTCLRYTQRRGGGDPRPVPRYRFSAHSLSCICTLYVALFPFCTSTYYNLCMHLGTAPMSDCTCTVPALCLHLSVPQHSASGLSVPIPLPAPRVLTPVSAPVPIWLRICLYLPCPCLYLSLYLNKYNCPISACL